MIRLRFVAWKIKGVVLARPKKPTSSMFSEKPIVLVVLVENPLLVLKQEKSQFPSIMNWKEGKGM